MRELRVLGVIFGDIEFNVSKVSIETRVESIVWQMGSVKSNICWNINSILGSFV